MINPVTSYGHAISLKPRVTQSRIISSTKTTWALSLLKRTAASPAPKGLNTSKQNTSSSNITMILVKLTFVFVQQNKCGPISSPNPFRVLNFVKCALFLWIVPLTIPKILLSLHRSQSNLRQSFWWSPDSNWSRPHRGSVLGVHLPAKAKPGGKDLLTPHRSSQKKKISWLDQPPCPSCATSTRAHHKLRRRLIPVSESNRSLIIQLLSRLSTLIGYSNTVGLQNGFSDGGPYDT